MYLTQTLDMVENKNRVLAEKNKIPYLVCMLVYCVPYVPLHTAKPKKIKLKMNPAEQRKEKIQTTRTAVIGPRVGLKLLKIYSFKT